MTIGGNDLFQGGDILNNLEPCTNTAAAAAIFSQFATDFYHYS